MASNTMAITVPTSLPSLSSDGDRLAAVGSLLCILNVSTPRTDTSMKRSQSAIELEVVEILANMRFTTVRPTVVAHTASTTAVALPSAEFTFAALSGNTSDTEKLPKGPESEESDDEYWLKEYAKSHRKRPGSSAARRLEKRLLVLQQVSTRGRSSVGVTEESIEETLQSFYRALVAEKSTGEALSGPPLPYQERAGPSEASREKLFPHEHHSASHPPAGIDAVSPGFTKELHRKVEEQFQPCGKRTLAGPASAGSRQNKKKNGMGKPRARKLSVPRREMKTAGEKGKSKVMVAKVEKTPYVTHSGRLVKKTLKMENVARCFLASF